MKELKDTNLNVKTFGFLGFFLDAVMFFVDVLSSLRFTELGRPRCFQPSARVLLSRTEKAKQRSRPLRAENAKAFTGEPGEAARRSASASRGLSRPFSRRPSPSATLRVLGSRAPVLQAFSLTFSWRVSPLFFMSTPGL